MRKLLRTLNSEIIVKALLLPLAVWLVWKLAN
jgi:hypothetical protein